MHQVLGLYEALGSQGPRLPKAPQECHALISLKVPPRKEFQETQGAKPRPQKEPRYSYLFRGTGFQKDLKAHVKA